MSMLKTLVNLGADINKPNERGETALLLAVKYGQMEKVKELLSLGAKPTEKEIAVATKGSEARTLLETAKAALEITKGMRNAFRKDGSTHKVVSNHAKSLLLPTSTLFNKLASNCMCLCTTFLAKNVERYDWIPAYAGMTERETQTSLKLIAIRVDSIEEVASRLVIPA